MRICGISDMHGNLDFFIEPCDVLCICGDIFPLEIQNYSKPCEKWFTKEFLLWCDKQPVKEVLLIGGNHDFWLSRHSDNAKLESLKYPKNVRITYLQDESYEYIDEDSGKVYTFYGTPWCHKFGDWAFMPETDDALSYHFEKIPDNLDVLLTHDAPYGVSDVCLQDVWWNKKEHIGSKPLANAVAIKQPKILLHGHLHTTNREKELLEKTSVYNVSLLDEKYEMVYKPLYLEI